MAENEGVTATTQVQGSQAVHVEPAEKPIESGPAMPEGGVEKFWDGEKGEYNWEAHAKELQWQTAQKGAAPAAAAVTQEAPTEAAEQAATDAQVDATAKQAGVNMDEVRAAIMETGTVTDEQRAAFNAVGVDDSTIDFLASKTTEGVKQHVETVTEYLGGDLAKVREFLEGKFTDDERAAFSADLSDPGRWRQTADFLRREMGIPAAPVGEALRGANEAPGAGGASTTAPITDAELNAAIQDPRWKTDKNFREEMTARARAANMRHTPQAGRAHTGGM
jgi:hypothetical protein